MDGTKTILKAIRALFNMVVKSVNGVPPDSNGNINIKLPEQVQPDWNENDENSPNYVKNRTHWAEGEIVEILSNPQLVGTTDGVYILTPFKLVEGSRYTVTWHGVPYSCIAYDAEGWVVIGDDSSAQPFQIVNFPSGFVGNDGTLIYGGMLARKDSDFNFSIAKDEGVVHKIDAKYLPVQVGVNTTGTTVTIGEEQVTCGVGAERFNSPLNNAIGEYSHAEGYETIARGTYSHAEGNCTKAITNFSHAEGRYTTARGLSSHAEGQSTTASGSHSHAEGAYTNASGSYSHAEGSNTTASGDDSHAEGNVTTAGGYASHAEGNVTTASGSYSHAEGDHTTASGSYSHAQGRYNVEDVNDKFADIVGNGSNLKRSNAYTLDWDGNAYYKGKVYIEGTNDDATGGKELATKEDVGELAEALSNINVKVTDVLVNPDLRYNESNNCYYIHTPFTLVDGETYIVHWNGTKYESVCTLIEGVEGVYALGDVSSATGGTPTGEPFIIVCVNDAETNASGLYGQCTALDGSTEITLSIAQKHIAHYVTKEEFETAVDTGMSSESVILPETTPIETSDGGMAISTPFTLVVGKTYEVMYAGTKYNSLCQIFQGEIALVNTEVPFFISNYPEGRTATNLVGDTFTSYGGIGGFPNLYGNVSITEKIEVSIAEALGNITSTYATKEYVDNNSGGITLDKMTQITPSANYDAMTADQNGISWNDIQEVYAEGEEGAVANVQTSFIVPLVAGEGVELVPVGGKVAINCTGGGGSATVDKIALMNFYHSDMDSLNTGDEGISWRNETLIEVDNTSVIVPSEHKLPLVAGEGVEFVVVGGKVVINCTGGGGDYPVVGTLDENNNIILNGNLSDGTYTISYAATDGNIEIGTLVVGDAGATNLFIPSTATLNQRWSNSSYAYKTENGYAVSAYINVSGLMDGTHILRVKGGTIDGNAGVVYFNNAKVVVSPTNSSSSGANANNQYGDWEADNESTSGTYKYTLGYFNGQIDSALSGASYVRVTVCVNTNSTAITADDIQNVVVTIDEPIVGDNNILSTAKSHIDVSSVFNNTGYMDGVRPSSTSPYYSTLSDYVTTGVFEVNTSSVFYIKGITIDPNDSNCRFGFAKEQMIDGNQVLSVYACTNGAINTHTTFETLGDKYYRVTFNTSYLNITCPDLKWFWFGGIGNGANLIVSTTPIQ